MEPQHRDDQCSDRRALERGSSETAAADLRFGLEGAVDGELPVDIVERMLRHAQDCPECAEELERLRRVKSLVRRSCADRAPRSLRERISIQYRSVTVTRSGSEGTTNVQVTTSSSAVLPPKL